MTELEAGESAVEITAPVSEDTSEPAKDASEEIKALPLSETPEFKTALREAQSGMDKRNRILIEESAKNKAEADSIKSMYDSVSLELKATQEQFDEAMSKVLGDDPDAKQAYFDRKALADEKRAVAQIKRDADARIKKAELLVRDVNMARKAVEVSNETGIPIEDLGDCKTEEAIEIAGLRYQAKNPKVEDVKTPDPSPKIDSGKTTGRGGELTNEDVETMDLKDYASHPSVVARYK